MTIHDILTNKVFRPKDKVEVIARIILEEKKGLKAVMDFSLNARGSQKATCIEAIELATKQNSMVANLALIKFISEMLTEKSPRVKWESAKVIGNIAHLFPDKLHTATQHLIVQTSHKGTVVRWSAAFALGEIVKTRPKDKELIEKIEGVLENEEKASIRKIYLEALKK